MTDYDTFEVLNTTIDQRTRLRNMGFAVEKLDQDYTNVTCSDNRADELTELLDSLGLEHKLV